MKLPSPTYNQLSDWGACEFFPLRLLLDCVIVPGPESGFGLKRYMSSLRIHFHAMGRGRIPNLSVLKKSEVSGFLDM